MVRRRYKLTNLEFYDILNFKMKKKVLQPKFIKPFSKGQITLPKDYRDYLDIDENSWLRISLLDDQILVQPVKDLKETRKARPKLDKKRYLQALLKIKGDWFSEKEIEKVRKEVEKRLSKHEESLT